MDFSQLKDILKNDPDSKFIFFDDGKPTRILISVEEYQRLLLNQQEREKQVEGKEKKSLGRGDTIEVHLEGRSGAGRFSIEDLPF